MGLKLPSTRESEKDTERYLTKRTKELGGLSFKWDAAGHRGVPDRILIFKGGKVIFVEVKSEDGKLSELQTLTIQEMRAKGCRVYVVYTKADVTQLIKEVENATG